MAGKKKRVAMSALFLAILIVVAGCNSGQSNNSSSSGNSAANTSASASSNADTNSATASDAPKEKVKISLFLGNGANTKFPIGIQTDPVAKIIEEKTGVQIEITRNPQKDVAAQVNTMLASGDLDDITYVAGDYSQDIAKNVTAAAKSGQIIPLDDLVAKYAPDIMNNPVLKARTEFNKKYASPDGQLWSITTYGGTTLETRPSDGIFIRWDLYKQLGYPQINNDDDLIKLLSDMKKLEPKTKEGKPVYGVGGWFGEGSGWGEALFRYGYAWSRGYYGYPDLVAYYDAVNRDLYAKNAITDTDSPYWNGLRFAYKLNQAGLLDPDSATQHYDQADEKLKNGQYLMFFSGWQLGEPANYFKSVGEEYKGYVALPAFQGHGNIQAMVNETSGYQYVISKNCKNPEAAMRLINFLSTPEGSRLVNSGVEGQTWEMKDGKPAYTDAYVQESQSTSDWESTNLQTGLSLYNLLSPWSGNVISPFDKAYFNLNMEPGYISKNYSDVEIDAMAHYGVQNLTDIYLNSAKTVMFINYDSLFQPMSDELKTAAANINSYAYKNEFKVIFAKNDDQFAKAQKSFLDGVAKFKPDEVYNYYKTEMAKAKPVMDPIINEAEKNYPFK
ncbi:extracellular solute-binding protein [Cohnella zeiphila]|uniref:Extracellular solute-binding protein n=1 Tax=Cohnella zeiphila TaxID=2761120 RepID=A0A7X0VY17_9BACL|nr:extracellular solute-binding protein [Cohnella zeiphila]MBB6734032.1 extracellular solute-binding protein [Cohnella zeiphila]